MEVFTTHGQGHIVSMSGCHGDKHAWWWFMELWFSAPHTSVQINRGTICPTFASWLWHTLVPTPIPLFISSFSLGTSSVSTSPSTYCTHWVMERKIKKRTHHRRNNGLGTLVSGIDVQSFTDYHGSWRMKSGDPCWHHTSSWLCS